MGIVAVRAHCVLGLAGLTVKGPATHPTDSKRRTSSVSDVYRLRHLSAVKRGECMKPRRRVGSRPTVTGRLCRAGACLLVAVLLGGSCSGGDGEDGDARSTTTTTDRRSTAETTVPPTDDERAAIDQYVGFWRARLEANAPPNPDHPSLAEFAVGAQLDNVINETRRRRDEGLAIRRPENSVSKHDVAVVSAAPDEITLQDCSVNDGVIYRVATGEVVNDDVVTQNIRATMRLVDGKWKLERAELVQEWPGVAGCALAG